MEVIVLVDFLIQFPFYINLEYLSPDLINNQVKQMENQKAYFVFLLMGSFTENLILSGVVIFHFNLKVDCFTCVKKKQLGESRKIYGHVKLIG